MVLRSFPIRVVDPNVFNLVLSEVLTVLHLKKENGNFSLESVMGELIPKVLEGLPQPTADKINEILVHVMFMSDIDHVIYLLQSAKYK